MIGQGSTGAANDLAGATDLATKMVREFGLSPTLGPIGYPEGGSVFLGGGGPAMSSRPFAEATQAAIDSEVSRLLREAEQRAVELLRDHRGELDALVSLLLEKETVDGADVYRLAGQPDRSSISRRCRPPPWDPARRRPTRSAVEPGRCGPDAAAALYRRTSRRRALGPTPRPAERPVP